MSLCVRACSLNFQKSSFNVSFFNGRSLSVARVRTWRKKIHCAHLWHISPCWTNSVKSQSTTYRTIHLGAAFGKLTHIYFMISFVFEHLMILDYPNFCDNYYRVFCSDTTHCYMRRDLNDRVQFWIYSIWTKISTVSMCYFYAFVLKI